MRVAVCEDNIQIMSSIENMVTQFFAVHSIDFEIDGYLSGERLLTYLSNNLDNQYHLYILDIEMGEINGFDVAKIIREKDEEALIIFITSHDEYIWKAFDVAAFHFLVKPIDEKKLQIILQRAIDRIQKKNNLFVYQLNKKMFTILYSNIQYFESDKRKINIYTNTNIYTFYSAMKDIEKVLPVNFVKIHKSYIVNLEHIELIKGKEIQMGCGNTLLISRSNYNDFYTIYRNFVVERMK